jgi:hypothetical protein
MFHYQIHQENGYVHQKKTYVPTLNTCIALVLHTRDRSVFVYQLLYFQW